jgi:aldehyde dehydrogenase (NAD+)
VAARYCEFYGGAADKLHGEQIPYLNDFQVSCCASPMA